MPPATRRLRAPVFKLCAMMSALSQRSAFEPVASVNSTFRRPVAAAATLVPRPSPDTIKLGVPPSAEIIPFPGKKDCVAVPAYAKRPIRGTDCDAVPPVMETFLSSFPCSMPDQKAMDVPRVKMR